MRINYAVFEIIGEECERISVWLTKSEAIAFLQRNKERSDGRVLELHRRIEI